MLIEKRQGFYGNDGSQYQQDSTGISYYRDWMIIAGAVLVFMVIIIVLRYDGRRRIRAQRPLLSIEKWLFPAHLRNGPPYEAPIQMTHPEVSQFGRHAQPNTISAPPPSYDPYAQALPAYQPKLDTTVGTSELPGGEASQTAPGYGPDGHGTNYQYTIPEASRR